MDNTIKECIYNGKEDILTVQDSARVQESKMYSAVATQAAAIAAMDKIPSAIEGFTCPKCRRIFATMDSLKEHYCAFHPEEIPPESVMLNINGKLCEVLIEPHWTLHRALQFRLGLTGAKHMCNHGACGSCTVIMDKRPVLSCTLLAIECENKKIWTVEGIAADPKWRPLIDAYCKWDAMQCGYCTTGFLMSARALLERNPHPTEEECKKALSGNICICGTYPRHATAIMEAAMVMFGEE